LFILWIYPWHTIFNFIDFNDAFESIFMSLFSSFLYINMFDFFFYIKNMFMLISFFLDGFNVKLLKMLKNVLKSVFKYMFI
jgi:hypothetical protein